MDAAQLVLFSVIIILTLVLLVLAVQVFFILRDFRRTINKANKVLDDTGNITESVSTPIASLSTLLMGLKTGAAFAQYLKKKKPKKDE